MKFSEIIITSFLFSAVSAQRFTYCGTDPCLIPIEQFSCEQLVRDYDFMGSCCRLVDNLATGGCRVEVGFTPGAVGGNCAWVPRCEPCDPNAGDNCGWEYSTETTSYACDTEEGYDALAIQQSWLNATVAQSDGSEAPSSVFFVDEPPSCQPTAAPVEQSDETPAPVATSSSNGMFVKVAAAATAAAAFALAL
jgi:hypothetical protein